MTTAHDFSQPDIDGTETSIGAFAGQVKLIVNVASKCGLTPQYTGLEELQQAFGNRGFVVLGFPCNQFGAQEPGSEAEIKTFCSTTYGVTFPMFSKLEVNGPDRHPLYAWLTSQATEPEGPGDIAWNFGKFLIDKDGHIVGRYSPRMAPAELADAIEAAL